jgi:hypothetical protein
LEGLEGLEQPRKEFAAVGASAMGGREREREREMTKVSRELQRQR